MSECLIDFETELPAMPSVFANIASMSSLPFVREPVSIMSVPFPVVSVSGPCPVGSVPPVPIGSVAVSVGSVAVPVGSNVRSYSLAAFWPLSAALWFEQAESCFTYFGEHDSRSKYHRVLMAMPESALKTVSDIVANPPSIEPYECLKDRLLASVRVSDYQKADKLMAMPSLGDRRPSEMMAAMLDQCPKGWSHENLRYSCTCSCPDCHSILGFS